MEQIKAPAKVRTYKVKIKEVYEEATLDEVNDNVNNAEFISIIPKMKPDLEIPKIIECSQQLVKHVVPGYVFRSPKFKFQPTTFSTESEQLNSKFIDSSKQSNSLLMFLKNPTVPVIYLIAGNPDDSKAKLFAAYLVAVHMKYLGNKANVVWESVYGGFGNKLVDSAEDNEQPTLIVICNLTVNSTNLKLEKARDIIEKFPDIPRLVISSGIDPISFAATKLFVPVHALAYFSDPLIKAQMAII